MFETLLTNASYILSNKPSTIDAYLYAFIDLIIGFTKEPTKPQRKVSNKLMQFMDDTNKENSVRIGVVEAGRLYGIVKGSPMIMKWYLRLKEEIKIK